MALTQIKTNAIADDAITEDKILNDAVTAAKIPANAIGASELANNAVDTAAIADNAETQAKVNVSLNRNFVVNGAMTVAQRGGTSVANGIHVVDRFSLSSVGIDGSPTQAQSDVAVGTTPHTLGFRKAFKATNGNQTSGAGAGDSIQMQTKLEAQDIANSGWNYTSSSSFVTLSFWVKSSVAQNFTGYIMSVDGTSQNYPFETGSLTANTWTKVTKTIPGNSNLEFHNNNDVGLRIFWQLFQGTDFTDSGVSLNTWTAYNSATRSPDNTSTWYTTNDATFELTGVQLEVGSTASSFNHESYAETLRKCQRYYVKFDGDVNAFRIGMGYVMSASLALIYVHLPVTMRTKPTTIDTNGTPGNYQVHTSTMVASTNVTVYSQSTPDLGLIALHSSSAFTASKACHLRSTNTTATIGLGCEL